MFYIISFRSIFFSIFFYSNSLCLSFLLVLLFFKMSIHFFFFVLKINKTMYPCQLAEIKCYENACMVLVLVNPEMCHKHCESAVL